MTQSRRHWRAVVLLLVVVAAAVAGCARTVSGHGTAANTSPSSSSAASSSSSPSGSESSSSGAGQDVACPGIVDRVSGLSYPCIANSMTVYPDGSGIWQTMLALRVETNWLMNEGSRELLQTTSVSLSTITTTLMDAMKKQEFWGPGATAKTEATKSLTVDGKKGALLQTLMTVSPAYRKAHNLKVKTEMVWVIALRTTTDSAAAFFCSVPDEVKKYWASIPRLINQIKVIG
jgi:hypothetical protein